MDIILYIFVALRLYKKIQQATRMGAVWRRKIVDVEISSKVRYGGEMTLRAHSGAMRRVSRDSDAKIHQRMEKKIFRVTKKA